MKLKAMFKKVGIVKAGILMILFSVSLWAGIDNAVMRGIVVSYDKKTVTILQRSGNKVKVPRKSIPKRVKLKTGIAVEAFLDSEKIIKRIKKIKEKEQKAKDLKNSTASPSKDKKSL